MTHLAQQAKQIFESAGVSGLQKFIRHARNAPYTTPLWTHGNTAIFLSDQSAIRHCRNRCAQRPDELPHLHFQWQEPDGAFHEEVLPATQDLPPYEPTDEHLDSITLLSWPTTESIHSTMLEIACEEAGVESDHLVDTPLGLAIIDTMAADSRRAVNEEMLDDQQPAAVMDNLDGLQRDYAEDAMKRVPKPQWTALVNYLKQRSQR